jgi:seryl-tRNA synthetase
VPSGFEKFVELENRVYRMIELHKALRAQKETLEKELARMKSQLDQALAESSQLREQYQQSQNDRELVREKVENILKSLESLSPDPDASQS